MAMNRAVSNRGSWTFKPPQAVWMGLCALSVCAITSAAFAEAVADDEPVVEAQLAQAQPPGAPIAEPPSSGQPAETAVPAGEDRGERPSLFAGLDTQNINLSGAELDYEVVNDQLILRGNQEDLDLIEALVRILEESREPKELRVVAVTEKDANEIARSLEPALRDMFYKPNQPQEDQVSIQAASSRVLLVSALPDQIDFIVELIQQVDESEVDELGKVEQLVFAIQYRKASDVAEQLREIIGKIREKQGARGPEGELQIIANNANNSIMVLAPESEREKIRKLLNEIDVEPAKGWGEVKLTLFPLLHSKASEMANTVEELLATEQAREAAEEVIFRLQISKALPSGEIVDLAPIDLQKPTRIIPDEGTNSLIVATVEENVKPMQELIQLLDGVPSSEELHIRLFPLRYADADTIGETLKEMFDQAKQLPEDPDGSGADGVPDSDPGRGLVYNVSISTDVRTNTLIVTGRENQLQIADMIVEQLDRPATALKFPLRMIQLGYSDATRVGQVLTELFDQRFQALEATDAGRAALERERLFLSVDIRSNALIVSASDENHDEVIKIARQLDTKPVKLFDQIRIIGCSRLSATDMKQKIEDLWQRKADLRRQEELMEDLPVVVADERSNSLIVASSVEDYEEIVQLIEVLEAQPLIDDTRLFKLEYADAQVLADMLDELFQGIEGQSESFKAPTILPDPRSNALVVAGVRDAMERVEDVIRRLDVKAGPLTAIFKVYLLQHGSAVKLAPRMQELFDSRREGDEISRTPVVILADETSNSLICSASRDDHETVVDLLGVLDRPSNIAKQFQIFPLKMAKATKVAEELDSLFQSQAEGASGRADAMAVEVDERTNSLIVWAAPSEMTNIQEVIERLDTSTPAVEMMVKIVQLRQAIADDFAQRFTDAVLGEDPGGDNERAVILSFTEVLPDGREVVRKLLRQDVKLEADSRTNSLMVMAPAESMAMLEAMIKDFDRMRPIQSEIRMFPLVNADAGTMVDRLKELFEGEGGAEGETVRQFNFGEEFSDIEFASVGQELRFAADTRTNTLIAAGAEIDLRMVEKLVLYLDAQEAEERVIEVIHAKFRDAQEIAAAIDGFNQQEQDVLGLVDDEESQQRRMERQVSIEAMGGDEGGSSQLIVGTSRQMYRKTMEMISELDRPEPQVKISALVAEVILSDDIEIGMEIAGQDLQFSEEAFIGPNGIIQGPNFDYIAGTDVGAIGRGLGGINFTVTGEDFSFLFHAAQQNSRVETLSRPSLVIRNGEEGNITIADRVPFVSVAGLSDTGQTQSQVSYEDVGIVLTATPQISPDGYVTIDLSQEISGFSGENVQLTEGVSSPVFQTREVKTNVTLRDGETVVIGGLITSRESEGENKVPILGDLPLIGPLFRVTSASKNRTELLIVLTVDVLRTDEQRYEMSVKERDMGLMPDSIRQSPLMEGLRILPDEAALGPVDEDAKHPARTTPAPQRKASPSEQYGPRPRVYGPTIRRPSTSTVMQSAYGPRVAKRDTEDQG